MRPASLLLSLLALAGLASAAQEFRVFRMLQYDMPFGNPLGSRLSQFSMEARTASASAASVSRRCVLVKLRDLSLERYRALVAQYAGALLVLLPDEYDEESRAAVKSLEAQLLHEEVKLPVYFIPESEEIGAYYEAIEGERANQLDSSAFQTLLDSVGSNGFQFDVSAPASQPLVHSPQHFQAVNLQGRLNGASAHTPDDSMPQKTPTIVVAAHYDASGLAPCLSYGCDSAGTGVVALLEIARVFSALYSNAKTVPSVNLLFLLTAEGQLNYHGLKKWIEEQSETSEVAGKVDLDDVLFAVCLDSLGRRTPDAHTGLYAHVSRPPKEGQPGHELFRALEQAANASGAHFEMVHKKINLGSELLAWDHERFSLNKIPAVTLSHFKSFKDADRASITDTLASVDRRVLVDNIRTVVQGLAAFVYRSERAAGLLLEKELDVSAEFVGSWLEQVCGTARAAQLLNKNHPLVGNLFAHFSHYLQEAVRWPVKVQAKEPEFVFYNQEEAKLMIYIVKPAVFDFFLALAIGGYLGMIYLFVLNFAQIFNFINHRFVASKSRTA